MVIPFLQKSWGEVGKISRKFILCDHVRNSHDHSVLQSIDITRRNLMLITLRASSVKPSATLTKGKQDKKHFLSVFPLLTLDTKFPCQTPPPPPSPPLSINTVKSLNFHLWQGTIKTRIKVDLFNLQSNSESYSHLNQFHNQENFFGCLIFFYKLYNILMFHSS